MEPHKSTHTFKQWLAAVDPAVAATVSEVRAFRAYNDGMTPADFEEEALEIDG